MYKNLSSQPSRLYRWIALASYSSQHLAKSVCRKIPPFSFLFPFFFFSREEQFSLERLLYHITCLALFLFFSTCQGKEVMYPLWADPCCQMLWSPKRGGGHHCMVQQGADLPQELQPHLSTPSYCKATWVPNLHSLPRHLIRKTFTGS